MNVVTGCEVGVGCRQDVQLMVPDAAQDEQLLEGRQEMQAVGQLHLVGLWAVIQGPPLLGPTHKRLCQALYIPWTGFDSCLHQAYSQRYHSLQSSV